MRTLAILFAGLLWFRTASASNMRGDSRNLIVQSNSDVAVHGDISMQIQGNSLVTWTTDHESETKTTVKFASAESTDNGGSVDFDLFSQFNIAALNDAASLSGKAAISTDIVLTSGNAISSSNNAKVDTYLFTESGEVTDSKTNYTFDVKEGDVKWTFTSDSWDWGSASSKLELHIQLDADADVSVNTESKNGVTVYVVGTPHATMWFPAVCSVDSSTSTDVQIDVNANAKTVVATFPQYSDQLSWDPVVRQNGALKVMGQSFIAILLAAIGTWFGRRATF